MQRIRSEEEDDFYGSFNGSARPCASRTPKSCKPRYGYLLGLGGLTTLILLALVRTGPPPQSMPSLHTALQLIDFSAASGGSAGSDLGKQRSSTYDWCFECAERCQNVLLSVVQHTAMHSVEGRLDKIGILANSLPQFYRGTDHLYLEDVMSLSDDAELAKYSSMMSGVTFVDSDQHLSNFGAFTNTYGKLVYDMNDFDQVMIGSYSIDLWRAAVSITIHSSLNGLEPDERAKLVHSFAYTYFVSVLGYVDNDNELSHELTIESSWGPVSELLSKVNRTRSRKKMLDKFAPINPSDGKRHFSTVEGGSGDVRLRPLSEERKDALKQAWPDYLKSISEMNRKGVSSPLERLEDPIAYIAIKDMAQRVGSGIGSRGSLRYYVLIEGPTTGQDDDVILDIKHEPTPEWFDYATKQQVAFNSFKNNGERVVTATKALHIKPSGALGYLELEDGAYLVNPRSPYKSNIDIDSLKTYGDFKQVVDQMAIVMATNHARADNDYNADIISWSFEKEFSDAVRYRAEEFIHAVADFADVYYARVQDDYYCLASAYSRYVEQHPGSAGQQDLPTQPPDLDLGP